MTRPAPRFAGRFQSARSLALQVLLDVRRGSEFVQEALDQRLRQGRLGDADRRLATQLAYGVLRRQGTLDALLKPIIQRQSHQVEPWLKDALRLGVYQLALLTHVPAHAAIYETVELAKAFGRPGAGGFLNGVLRSASALVTPEIATQPAADALPLEAGQYRKLARPVLPDPGTNSVEYLAAGFAWPRWLAERWLQRFGWEECLRLGFWFAGPGPLWLRINPLRTNREAYQAGLREAGVEAAAGEHPQAIRLAHHVAVRELPGYDKGWFTVQDESAMRVGSALSPQPGSRVLDLCAAPGGKTTHLAELMQNKGEIIACDIVNRRLETLAELARRLGLSMIQTRRLDTKQDEEPPAGPFDAILVDAPCSNTGVLGRRPEARWRLRSEDFRRLVPLQTTLLLQASERIRPGCAIVYATCSIEPEENQQVVQAVLSGNTGLQLEAEDESRPGRPADGGYWARLRRRS